MPKSLKGYHSPVYKKGMNIPRSRVVFLDWLKLLGDQLQDQRTRELDPSFLVRSVRTTAFMLEALFRLHKKQDVFFKNGLRLIKSLEDAIGAYDYQLTMLETLHAMNISKPVVQAAYPNLEESKRSLAQSLDVLWIDAPTISEMVTQVQHYDFGDHEKNRRFLQSRIQKRIQKVMTKTYDFTDLEDGIHEYRRQLRWFPMYFYALKGLLVFDESHPIKIYQPLIHSPLADSAYGKLPNALLEQNPITISQSLYLGLSQLIGLLGDVKDNGQLFEYTEQLLISDFGYHSEDAHTKACSLFGLPPHFIEQIKAQGYDLHRRAQQAALLENLQAVFSAP